MSSLNEDVAQFVEQVGLFFEGEGLSRTSGRLMGLLLVKPGLLSLDEMADFLHMSKASISTNIRILEHFGLAERISLPGDRRDHYRLVSDPWGRVTALSIERARTMATLAERGLKALAEDDAEARERLEEVHDFYVFMVDEIADTLRRWQERKQRER